MTVRHTSFSTMCACVCVCMCVGSYRVLFIQGEDEAVTEVWPPLMDEDDHPFVLDPSPGTVRAVRFYVMFLLLWQSLCRVSDSGMNVFLAMFLVPGNQIRNFVSLLPRTVAAGRN